MTYYVPDQKALAFKARLAEHLGLDLDQVTDLRVEVIGGDAQARVTWSGQVSVDTATVLNLMDGLAAHGPTFSRVPGQH